MQWMQKIFCPACIASLIPFFTSLSLFVESTAPPAAYSKQPQRFFG
jgi:hypothetical protein